MDSLQFYDDHVDENEESGEESQRMHLAFSVNEVEIEEVSVVVETQELVTEEVEVVPFKNNANNEEDNNANNEEDNNANNEEDNNANDEEDNNANDEEDNNANDEEDNNANDEEDNNANEEEDNNANDEEGNNANDEEDNLPVIECSSNPINKDLNGFGKGEEESVDPGIVSEAEGLHAPNPVDQVCESVDLNRETCEVGVDFTASEGDILMTENDEAPSEVITKAMEDADEGTGTLQQTELDGKHALTFDGVTNGHQEVELDALDIEVDDQQLSPEPAPEPMAALSDGRSAGQDPEEVPADLTENEEIINEDSCEKQIEASEHADTEREGSALDPQIVNSGDNDDAQAGNPSALKENANAEEGLESASNPEQLFNDANLAQLRAQILVMGILRKGSKPSDEMLTSACPTSIEGTFGAATAEDIGNVAIGSPSPSRKRKSYDNQVVFSDDIATSLMNVVKDNLHLSQSQDALLLDDTDRQLRSAQVSAHDAMATATSALAQSHLAWTQIKGEDHSETGIAREAQIASVAATVAAAASVAKAAVEAAKAIANVSYKAFAQSGQKPDGQSPASQSKRNRKSSLARNRKSDMLDSVVRVAGMAAEAATQAGTVLASKNPFMQAGEVNEAKKKATRVGSGKPKATPKKKATKMSKGRVSASPKTTPLKASKDGSKKNDVPTRGKTANEDKYGGKTKSPKTHKDSRQPSSPAKSDVPHKDLVEVRDGGEIIEKSKPIARGSVVEIMTEEVGLRGGWFSGKVLKMAKGQAFVVYDEILNDDGSKLEEWFPFKASGDPAGPRRQVRPVHPYSSIKEAGSKKRRRVTMGSQTWTSGDHVDGFIQDAWWEGILLELNDFDESKATVYFPGENDTQTVKIWDLRPSLQWEDGKWVSWVNSTALENEHLRTQGKEASSSGKVKKGKLVKANVPKLTAKAKNVKKSPEKFEAPSHEVDESSPPRPTRKGKAQDLSAKATEPKKSPRNSEDSRKKVDESIPSRSTRQGNLQELSTKASKAKKSSKNLEVPIDEVNEPSPSKSSRKRKGSELSSESKREKKNPRVREDSVIEPTPTRSTRSSPGGKKPDDMITANDGKRSTNKISDKKSSGGKKTKLSNIRTVKSPKKSDPHVDTTEKTTKKSETLEVTMAKTRGKDKAEEVAKKRSRRR